MGNWVRGIATFLIVHGAFDLVVGLLCLTEILTGFSLGSGGRPQLRSPATVAVLALFLLVYGVLQIWVGMRNRKYRSRTLGVVALSMGLLDPFAYACTIVFLAISILGLVAYLGREGTKAFEWGEAGCSVEEVQRALRDLRQSPPAGSHSNRGLIIALVVLAAPILFAVVGVVSVIAMYGVRKYIVNAKRAEAQTIAAELARGIARCANQRGHLPPTSGPVPADLAGVRGMKYQSAARDWMDEAFACAGFSLTHPQYFQYQWVKQGDHGGVVQAIADLDGDGQPDQEHRIVVVCEHGQCSLDAPSPAASAL